MKSVATNSIPQPPPELSLDERIRRAELRLIAREDRVKRRLDLFGHRMHDALQPRRYIAPAIGIAVASWALWMMMSRRRVRPATAGATAHGHGRPWAAALGGLPWVHLLPLVWPLLPTAWRARINPATAATVVSVGVPLVERLFAPRAARRRA
jgi:hypothetical protein